MAEVAAAVSGVHAQVLSAAEVSAALRVEGATRQDVRHALWADRTLVKTFGPRGTVHLLPAADLGRWMAALGALPWRSPFPDGVRMRDDETRTVVAAIGEALRGGDLTVDELTEAIGDVAGAWAAEPVMPAFQTLWPRWRQVTDRAAYAGVLCYGPDRARKVTYARPPDAEPVEPDAAVAWAIEQYLRSYGPATPASFAPWFGSTPAWASERMAATRPGPRGARRRAGLRLAGGGVRRTARRGSTAAAVLRRVRRRQPAAAPALPGSARERAWCHRARPATTPCCSSTARWPASGTRSARAGRSPSPSSR
jgi:hypothetical protein